MINVSISIILFIYSFDIFSLILKILKFPIIIQRGIYVVIYFTLICISRINIFLKHLDKRTIQYLTRSYYSNDVGDLELYMPIAYIINEKNEFLIQTLLIFEAIIQLREKSNIYIFLTSFISWHNNLVQFDKFECT